ncbi:MAG: hypothetical protein Q7K03_02255 [Dehalococcoidia bacterium]|nr:hypothetical protein [Dehalococcoidia bacterium]
MKALPEPPTPEEIILLARTIGCRPTSLKAKVFAYFAKGFSPQEVRLLLPRANRETIRSYWDQWAGQS